MEAIKQVRPLEKDILEVEHYELANLPSDVAVQLARYLGCEEQGPALGSFFKAHRTDQHSDHDWSNRLLLNDVAWTDHERRVFLEICGQQMEQFGYPM